MNSSWSTIPVGDALEKITRQKKVPKSDYDESGLIPIIDQGREYLAGYTNDPDLQYNGKLPLTVFGDHTRILKWVARPFALGADGTQILRGDSRFDQRFFYYALKSVDLKHFGYERHFKYLKEKEIPLPDLPTQRKIAGILSAYDDLIENNLRRIKILEEMAQSLYREWFVHFRFPGHESQFSSRATEIEPSD
jgi:type I restriction enzyme, S subunit